MKTQKQVLDFIEKAFGDVKLSKAGLEASVICPVCANQSGEKEKKKLCIRTDNWFCHCWVCGVKRKNILGLLRAYKPYLVEEYLTLFSDSIIFDDHQNENNGNKQIEKIQLPSGFILLAPLYNKVFEKSQNSFLSKAIIDSVKYLSSRGLTEEDLWYFKIGISLEDVKYQNRVIIPSHDKFGNLNFFTTRTVKPRTRPCYWNPPYPKEEIVFNEINIDWNSPLTIVEGPFDLFKANENATCLLGKELKKNSRLFTKLIENQSRVILCLDNDAKKDRAKIAELLLSYGLEVSLFDLPKNVKDPGSWNKKDFQLNLSNAKIVDEDELLKLKIQSL